MIHLTSSRSQAATATCSGNLKKAGRVAVPAALSAEPDQRPWTEGGKGLCFSILMLRLDKTLDYFFCFYLCFFDFWHFVWSTGQMAQRDLFSRKSRPAARDGRKRRRSSSTRNGRIPLTCLGSPGALLLFERFCGFLGAIFVSNNSRP